MTIPVVAPLYIPLSDTETWDRVFRFPPQVGIININNGPGPAQIDELWYGRIGRLWGLGVQCLGYVDTDYGRRALAPVLEDMMIWFSYRVQALFFDQVLNEQSFIGPWTPMTQAYKNVRSSKGAIKNVMNLGVKPDNPVWGITAQRNTAFVTFEGTAWSYLDQTSSEGVHLVHSCPLEQAPEVFAKADAQKALGLYVTPDVPPNPWDSYWPQAHLAKGVLWR